MFTICNHINSIPFDLAAESKADISKNPSSSTQKILISFSYGTHAIYFSRRRATVAPQNPTKLGFSITISFLARKFLCSISKRKNLTPLHRTLAQIPRFFNHCPQAKTLFPDESADEFASPKCNGIFDVFFKVFKSNNWQKSTEQLNK
uniref:Uncharacterized protein n=1 Tax=Romanomermis culicivorax TaxID=13658 RepID=A0A915HYK6_ROMCU